MKHQGLFVFFVLLALAVIAGCSLSGSDPVEAYVVECSAAEEDFVDFSAMTSFMNGGSWAILEKVKIPASGVVGWHFFRGKGWEDKEGDVAIQIRNDVDTGQVYAWVYKAGWKIVQMDKNDVPGLEVLADTWYTVCLQYDAADQKFQLYVNGSFIEEITVAPLDDSANTNKLFFGGQDVDPAELEGALYTEADCIFAHQAWVQRALTAGEIAAYDGSFALDDPDLFFATEITSDGVLKAGGTGGADGVIGNTPEFYLDTM